MAVVGKVIRLETSPVEPIGQPLAALAQMAANLFEINVDEDETATSKTDFIALASKQFILTEASFPRVQLTRSLKNVTAAKLDHFVIRLLVSGSVRGLAGHRTLEATAGDILFVDLSQALNLQFTLDHGQLCCSEISFWIPRSRLLAAFRNENALHGLVIKGSSPAGAMISINLRSFRKHAENMSVVEMDALGIGVLELIASALPHLQETAGLSSVPARLDSFVTIRRYIDRNLTSKELDADAIAERFGLSRASLYRLFEPIGGIASYIRKARLARAYQDLTSSEFLDRRISQVAFNLGFRNIGAFNRQFQKAFGMSPRAARQQLREGLTRKLPGPIHSSEAPFASLLAQIGAP